MTLRIALLGSPELREDSTQLDLPGYRPLALLAYLLLSGKPQTREHLVDFLYDRPDDPRAALRWTLSQLRKAIGPQAIRADRQTIAFNFESDHWLDVSEFEAGDLDLYRGELLEGLNLRDARRYEAWLLVERERLRARYQAGLEERLQEQRAAGDAEAVEETALLLLALDNLREDWHRALMSAYARQGKFEAAHAQYELCQTLLREELDTAPAPATVALAEAIEQEQAELYSLLAERPDPSLPFAGSVKASSAPQQTLRQPAGAKPATVEKDAQGKPWRTGGVIGAILLLLLVFVFNLDMRSSLGSAETSAWSREFAGTTVTITGDFGDATRDELLKSLALFEEETGINIEFIYLDDVLSEALPSLVATERTPDIVSHPQPAGLVEFVRQGQIVDVRTFLEEDYLLQQYGEALLEASMIEGQMAGVWHRNQIKSLVWYAKKAFDEAGYEAPQTWEELLALSDQIVADGGTPWCIAIEDGIDSGWLGTDWVEDILLRTAPPEMYDAWVAGELPFDSPEIRRVFTIMGDIWFHENYVRGGREMIASQEFWQSVLPLVDEPPGCFMTVQGSFITAVFQNAAEDTVYGEDFDFFYLPPIDEVHGRPVLGAGDMMVMFNDRPEVREVMRYLTTPESTRYLVQEGGAIAPHRNTPFEWYATPGQLKMAQILLEADTYRFDASDLMPAEVGGGTFLQGMMDWVQGEDLDTVLQEIDASWPQKGDPARGS